MPYLFTGKELDQETGLYYFGARYYDPQTALWQSADPALSDFLADGRIDDPARLALMSYARGNPLRLYDPDGRDWTDFGANLRRASHEVSEFAKFQAGVATGMAERAIARVGRPISMVASGDFAEQAAGVSLLLTQGIRLTDAAPSLSPIESYESLKAMPDAQGGSFEAGRAAAPVVETAMAIGEMLFGGAAAGAKNAEKLAESGVKATSSSATASAGSIHGHHAWPKYLGGPPKQSLAKLPKDVHSAYHSGLDKILPRQRGAAHYSGLTGDAKRQAMRDLSDYTQAFDRKYGTDLYKSMVDNGFKIE